MCIFAVTPLAGVWIEIVMLDVEVMNTESLPLRECGLKFAFAVAYMYEDGVTPLAGVWIEITKKE